ncbi:glycosyltransferase family 4 protein [Candidatus Kaiserbacteria bacterium]|nr:glycosyltransferase family 4 protein [Candidatus Kaiserbacteria bacterium]
MKILIATGVYPPDIGGPATYTKMLEEHLPKYGYDVSVLPFKDVRYLPKVVRHVAYFAKCLRRAKDADVIFAQDPVSVGVPALVAAKMLRKPFFLRVGGDYAWEQGTLRFGVTASLEEFACGNGARHPMVTMFRWIERAVARCAKRVAVQGAFMKKIVSCWGIAPERVSVIPNGFSGIPATVGRQAERESLGISGTVAVSAGRLVPWKGFAELIEVVPEILKAVPDFVLYIIGDGPDAETLRRMVVERHLTQRVFFTGRLEKGMLMRYLRAADVFVLNTRYEGFSNQLLEVMASGTPIVTTDIEGNAGVIDDGMSGLVVPLHDTAGLKTAVLNVLADKHLAQKLADGGKKKLQEFSVERVVAATHEFLSER